MSSQNHDIIIFFKILKDDEARRDYDYMLDNPGIVQLIQVARLNLPLQRNIMRITIAIIDVVWRPKSTFALS